MSRKKLNDIVGKYNSVRSTENKESPSKESKEVSEVSSKKRSRKLEFNEPEGHTMRIYDLRKKTK